MHPKKMWLQKMLWMQLLVLSENKFEWKFFILLAKRQMLWMPGLVLSQTSIWQNLSRRLGCHSSQIPIDELQIDNFKITIIYDTLFAKTVKTTFHRFRHLLNLNLVKSSLTPMHHTN